MFNVLYSVVCNHDVQVNEIHDFRVYSSTVGTHADGVIFNIPDLVIV